MARMMGKFKWHAHSKPPRGISSLRPRENRVVAGDIADDIAGETPRRKNRAVR